MKKESQNLVIFLVATFIWTWVYLKTDRSILSAIFMHFTSNFTGQLLMPLSNRFEVFNMILMLALGLVVCAPLKIKPQNPAPEPHHPERIGADSVLDN